MSCFVQKSLFVRQMVNVKNDTTDSVQLKIVYSSARSEEEKKKDMFKVPLQVCEEGMSVLMGCAVNGVYVEVTGCGGGCVGWWCG